MRKIILSLVAVMIFLLLPGSSAVAYAEDGAAYTAEAGYQDESQDVSDEENTEELPSEEVPLCRTEPVVSLDGKTVMLIGNSMFYYGNCVIHGSAGKADYGYFYRVASANGENVKVLDYTYGGHTLDETYDEYLKKMSAEKRAGVDYVVMSEANIENEDLLGSCKRIAELFPEETKFVYMCNPMMHYKNMESLLKGVEELRKENFDIVDWGRLVYDIYSGNTAVPGGNFKYDFCSFIIDNVDYSAGTGLTVGGKKADVKHPNPLSGYIEAQMLYSAITNRSALYTDYSFCYNKELASKFDIDSFALKYYTGTKKTNFTDIFRSPADMFGIQSLIDDYLVKEGKHIIYVNEYVAPGCNSGGLSEGYYCSVCGETVKEQEYIQSKGGHTVVYEKAVAPTCTKAGKSGSAYCSVCKEYLIKSSTLKATGHSDTTMLTAATTESDGKKTVSCTVCNKTISSEKIPKIASITLSAKEFIYDGKSKTPKVTVKASDGKTLENGKDYTVTYPEKRKEVGNYKLTVAFKGKYSGTKSFTFKIRAGVTSSLTTKSYLNAVKLTWKKVEGATGYRVYVYNTKTKKYEKYADTKRTAINVKKRKTGTEYKFRVKAYTVVGEKIYYAYKYKSISAVTKPAKVTLGTLSSSERGEVTLSWKKVSRADGYRIIYADNSKFKSSEKLTVSSGKTVKRTVKNLKSGKKYYFKVRAYKTLDGKKVYGPYSSVKNITVKR